MANDRYAYIKMVFKPSAQGRHLYRDHNDQPREQMKARGAGVWFSPSWSRSRNQINSGFWELIDNPWFGQERTLPQGFDETILKQEQIPIQSYLEIKYNHPKGYWTSDADPHVTDAEKETALQRFTYVLKEGIIPLNLDREMDEVMYYLALVSNKIANSAEEVNSAKHDFYIAKIDEDEQKEIAKVELMVEASALLQKIKSELPFEKIKKIAIILELASTDMNESSINALILKYITDNSTNTSRDKNCKEFIKIGSLLFGKKDDKKRFDTMYFMQLALNHRILAFNKNNVVWPNAPSQELYQIGNSKLAALNWLLDPNNKEHFDLLQTELEAKSGIKL